METINALDINIVEIKMAALKYRAINHQLRQDMIHVIDKAGKITVTELYRKMGLEQSVTSQHLAILRRSGFVTAERSKRFIFYRVNYEAINFIEEESRKLLSQLWKALPGLLTHARYKTFIG